VNNTNLEMVFQGEHKVRMVIDRFGAPWWVAKDVCEVLGLANPRTSLALLADDEKGVHTVDTPGGPQEMAIVNESGLYALIFRSRKQRAKQFRKWVTSVVLPEIRKHGAFMAEEVRTLMHRVDEDRLVIGKLGEAIETLLQRHEEDRKFWLARDTQTTERLNKISERLDQQDTTIAGIQEPKAIGREAGRKILDWVTRIAWKSVNVPANYGLLHKERKKLALKAHRKFEDELRRAVSFPRDTGNAWTKLSTSKASQVYAALNTKETEIDREVAAAVRADATGPTQRGLFDEPQETEEQETEAVPPEERPEDKPN
jgi:prophage antirepressor-like protein